MFSKNIFSYPHLFFKIIADKISHLGSGVMLMSKLLCSTKGGKGAKVLLVCACTVPNTKGFQPIITDLYLLCSDCKNIICIPRHHILEVLFWFDDL